MIDTPLDQGKNRKGFVKQPRCFFEIKEMTANVAFVWNFLASHTDNYHPSLAEICEKTKLSNRTVIGSIKKLESYNMIKVARSKRGLNKIPNKYFLILDESKWSFPSCVIQHHEDPVMCNPAPRSCVIQHHDHVKNSTTKESKEESKEKDIVLQPVDNCNVPQDVIEDIKKYSRQIHPWVSEREASEILIYYIKEERKNPERCRESLKRLAKGLRIGSRLPKSARLSNGLIIFDTAFKIEFRGIVANV